MATAVLDQADGGISPTSLLSLSLISSNTAKLSVFRKWHSQNSEKMKYCQLQAPSEVAQKKLFEEVAGSAQPYMLLIL